MKNSEKVLIQGIIERLKEASQFYNLIGPETQQQLISQIGDLDAEFLEMEYLAEQLQEKADE